MTTRFRSIGNLPGQMKIAIAHAVAMFAALMPVLAIAQVNYTFDSNNQNWRQLPLPQAATFNAAGGNPGGYIHSGLPTPGNGAALVSPQSLAGNQSGWYGGLLSFDAKTNQNPSNAGSATGRMTLKFDYSAPSPNTLTYNIPTTPSLDPWTHFAVPILASKLVGVGGGQTVFVRDFVLQNLTALELQHQGSNGFLDDLSLDNVRVQLGSRVDPPVSGPGSSPSEPVLPSGNVGGGFAFSGGNGSYFDPPAADGYEYKMTAGELFTYILDFPAGFAQPFEVFAGGATLGTFAPGQDVDFTSFPGGGVNSFSIRGISPLVDAGSPLAFPLRLGFNAATADFVMTPLKNSHQIGDYDGDGVVGPGDFGLWNTSFGSTSELAADGNGNGVVDAADYSIWRDRVGLGTIPIGSGGGIPEPTTATMAVIAGLTAFVGCARRRRPFMQVLCAAAHTPRRHF